MARFNTTITNEGNINVTLTPTPANEVSYEQTNYNVTLSRVGPQGSPGTGSLIIGDGPPANTLGVDGQIYADRTNRDLYIRDNGEWIDYNFDDSELIQNVLDRLDSEIISRIIADSDLAARIASLLDSDTTYQFFDSDGGFAVVNNVTGVRQFVSIGMTGDSDTNGLWNSVAQGDDAATAVRVERMVIDSSAGFDLIEIDAAAGIYQLGQITPFGFTYPGLPSSNVFTAAPQRTVTVSATGGTLLRITNATITGGANISSTANQFTYSNYAGAGSYTVTITAIGTNSAGDSETRTLSRTFNRFVPYFFATRSAANAPAATSSGILGMTASTDQALTTGDTVTFSGSAVGDTPYLAIPTSVGTNPILRNSGFDFPELTESADVTLTDVATNTHLYRLYSFGPVDTDTRTFEFVML